MDGDLAKVTGNTYVSVGDKINNPMIKVNNIVYGGGRGSDTGEDASSLITVEGNSTVVIVGMNTTIQNYGSTKLGSVAGDVNVTFDTYRKSNVTNPYVTMNGIDRATTVSLINSYIALENIGEDGKKEGIKNIGNLSVPNGSGLKVTATGEISGNFIGGGSFYLDSKVSLKVGGDVIGTTTLVINPQITEEEDEVDTPLVIKGTRKYAYLIVKGNSLENNIVCTDERYASKLRYYYDEENVPNIAYFYMESDIGISEQIRERFVSKKDINYAEDSGTWGDIEKVEIKQDGIVTTDIDMVYNFDVANGDKNSYQNMARSLIIEESALGGSMKYFPDNTFITMIADGAYYKYVTSGDTARVYLSDFVELEDSSKNYEEIKNIVEDSDTIQLGKTSNSIIYTRNEHFRFIVDFTYISSNLPIETYIIYLNLENNEEDLKALEPLAENIIDLKEVRKYEIIPNIEARKYVEKDKIKIELSIDIGNLELNNNTNFINSPLCTAIIMKDKYGREYELPATSQVKLGDNVSSFIGGVARINLLNSLGTSSYNDTKEIVIDLSNNDAYYLKSDIYSIEFRAYLKDSYAQKILSNATFDINITRSEGADVVAIMTDGTNVSKKQLGVEYFGDAEKPYAKIKLEKLNNSEYVEVEQGLFEVKDIADLKENETRNIELDVSKVSSGKYRFVIEVYGHADILYSTSAINFEK